jgi:hypothetical protein
MRGSILDDSEIKQVQEALASCEQEIYEEHIRQDIGHASIATTARYATVTSQEISLGKNTIKW